MLGQSGHVDKETGFCLFRESNHCSSCSLVSILTEIVWAAITVWLVSSYEGVLIQKFILNIPMQNNEKIMRFELLMTQVIKDSCVVGCEAPTLQMVLTRNLKDPLKRQYTCTGLHGVIRQ